MKILLTLLLCMVWTIGVAEEEETEGPTNLTGPEKALFQSAYDGKLEQVQALVGKGASVNTTDNTERTPLMWAALRGHTDVVEFLVSKGANVNARDDDDRTPLIYACRGSATGAVKFLLEHGAEVNARTRRQYNTPLITAVQAGDLDAVKLLLQHGADAGLKDRDGFAAEQIARDFKHPEIAELLKNLTATSPDAQPAGTDADPTSP